MEERKFLRSIRPIEVVLSSFHTFFSLSLSALLSPLLACYILIILNSFSRDPWKSKLSGFEGLRIREFGDATIRRSDTLLSLERISNVSGKIWKIFHKEKIRDLEKPEAERHAPVDTNFRVLDPWKPSRMLQENKLSRDKYRKTREKIRGT